MRLPIARLRSPHVLIMVKSGIGTVFGIGIEMGRQPHLESVTERVREE